MPSAADAAGPNRARSRPSASVKPSSSATRLASTSACESHSPVEQSNADRVGSGSALRHPMPTASAYLRSGLPVGWCIHEPPRSTRCPARSAVCNRPPTRPRASSTTHSTPAWVSALATVSPAMPAPTTTTRSTGPRTPPGIPVCPSSNKVAMAASRSVRGTDRRRGPMRRGRVSRRTRWRIPCPGARRGVSPRRTGRPGSCASSSKVITSNRRDEPGAASIGVVRGAAVRRGSGVVTA